MSRAYIGVGSNIDPERNVLRAFDLLRRRVRATAVSTFYETEALGRPGQPRFVNGVFECETELSPWDLKSQVLRPIEANLGRLRAGDPYAPRTMDLDLLAYDLLEVRTADLVLPHPDIAGRAFVAVPLQELAPGLVVPGSSTRQSEVVLDFRGRPLASLTWRLRRLLEAEFSRN